MDISIQKNAIVSIHEQLVAQISLQITSGLLLADQKLPSIRALSRKLNIHYNTCLSAYHELEKIGLITIRQGSGARVSSLNKSDNNDFSVVEAISLKELSKFYVQQILANGYAWDEALVSLENAYAEQQNSSKTLLFVDRFEDILPLFKNELEIFLKRPVLTSTLDNLNTKILDNTHVIVSKYYAKSVEQFLVKTIPQPKKAMSVIDVGGGQQEIDILKKVPIGSLVVVISLSTSILQQAEAVITAVRGNDLLIRTIYHPQEGVQDILEAVEFSKIVFADLICKQKIEQHTTQTLYPIRVIPDTEIKKLKAV